MRDRPACALQPDQQCDVDHPLVCHPSNSTYYLQPTKCTLCRLWQQQLKDHTLPSLRIIRKSGNIFKLFIGKIDFNLDYSTFFLILIQFQAMAQRKLQLKIFTLGFLFHIPITYVINPALVFFCHCYLLQLE